MAESPTKARASTTRLRVWHFQCPACGFGDQELGHLLGDDEIHCEICISAEDRLIVRVRRWHSEEER